MKEFRNPNDIHQPLAAYSHQVEIDPSERLLVLSGQVGMQQDGTIPENPSEQLKVALNNIHSNLKAAKMSIKDIVKLTFYIVDQMDAADRKAVLDSFFDYHKPCMTLLFVSALAAPAIKIEIDAMASCKS